MIARTKFPDSFLDDPNWPEAVPDYLVCKTDYDRQVRALITSEWVGNKGPVLYLGKDSARVTGILNAQGVETGSSKFRAVVLNDIIDHLSEDRVRYLRGIKNILLSGGTVRVRCHPWCGRYGGHQTVNRAYAHLVYPDRWPVEKNLDPVGVYENLFKFSGFKILNRTAHRRHIEDWIIVNLGAKLLSYWPEEMWKGCDCPSVLPYLELEYLDYEVSLES